MKVENYRLSKGDQSWDFFGRTDAKAETPVLWPPHAKSWLIGKDSDAGSDRGQEEKGTTQDEMAGWHHQLNGCEFEWTLGVGDGLGRLSCCDSWGRKESDMTERLNWTELNCFMTNRTLQTCWKSVMPLPNHSLIVFWEGKLGGHKRVNQPQCLSAGEWVNKLRCTQTEAYRSYKDCLLINVTIGLARKRIILSERSKTGNATDCMIQ